MVFLAVTTINKKTILMSLWTIIHNQEIDKFKIQKNLKFSQNFRINFLYQKILIIKLYLKFHKNNRNFFNFNKVKYYKMKKNKLIK